MMITDRRTMIGTGAALTAMLASGACAREADSPTADPVTGPSGLAEVIRVWADEDGVSHVERVMS